VRAKRVTGAAYPVDRHLREGAMMELKERCQSCGMPISDAFGNRGSEADRSPSPIYCSMCFQTGAFTDPDLTLEGMIAKSVQHMTSTMGFAPEVAEQMSRDVIPTLKRWRVP
jgi:hypothetical protein